MHFNKFHKILGILLSFLISVSLLASYDWHDKSVYAEPTADSTSHDATGIATYDKDTTDDENIYSDSSDSTYSNDINELTNEKTTISDNYGLNSSDADANSLVSPQTFSVDAASTTPHIIYQAHSQSIGWQDSVSDGTMAGTYGKNLRLEALNINLSGIGGSINYRGFVQDSGWQPYTSNGNNTGTTGKGKSLMAIQISLSGEVSEKYDLYYQIHKSNIGWMGWQTEGKQAGTSCITCKIEAIQIVLVPKGAAAPVTLSNFTTPVAYYSAHVQDIGWQTTTNGAGVAGTTGNKLSLEASKIALSSAPTNFNIQYSMYVQNEGWQDYIDGPNIAGTTGRALKTYGLKVRLTGYNTINHNVYYRTYTTNKGWGEWVSDGSISGYPDTSDMIEAFQVRILKKGERINNSIPITSQTPITLSYSTHIQSIGWQNTFYNGDIAGTTGKAKRVEAIKISFEGISSKSLGIRYKAHVQSIGWQDWVANGNIAGTTGQAKRVEAIKIELTGTMADDFDIYYRVHSQTVGWLDWACNGETAGSTGLAYRIEALQIMVVPKGNAAPGSTDRPNLCDPYTFIDVSHHQNNAQYLKYGTYDLDWQSVKASGISQVMVRIQYGKTKDTCYKENISGASKAGLQVGAYCYSLATTVAEAEAEAQAIISALKGYNIELPIAYDIEDAYYQGTQSSLNNKQRTELILAFKKVIEDNGYKFILYANTNWLQNLINTSSLGNTEIWMARYNVSSYNEVSTDKNGNDIWPVIKTLNIKMWQYSSTGVVPGIAGNVDMNKGYKYY